jgi:oligosaccharide repeat unit polymerase
MDKAGLSLRPLVFFWVLFLGVFIPLSYWFGWSQPSSFDLRGQPYPVLWAQLAAGLVGTLLFAVPMVWIYRGKVIDVLALAFGLHALLVWSYFLFGSSAQQIFGAEQSIYSASAQVVADNTVGFLLLLAVLAGTYSLLVLQRKELPRLPGTTAEVDLRLLWVLYPMLFGATMLMASPMLLTGKVPVLSGDPVAARLALEQSAVGRPLYNLGASLFPTLAAACLVLAFRRRRLFAKVFNPGTALAAFACAVQLATSNRQPIAVMMMTFFALFSMERKLPRAILPVTVLAFFVVFMGMGGFSSILRQHREVLDSGENIIAASYEEAFLGDNMSDMRDGAWVFGEWNFEPLNGMTYLGGLTALMPSAIFPEKEKWYLGHVSLRIVGWPTEEHFGLRLGFFDEAFLNFGLAGVVGLAVILGSWFGLALRWLHLSAAAAPCLTRNLRITLLIQVGITLCNSSQGFVFYSLFALLALMWIGIDLPLLLHRWLRGASHPA